MGSGTQENCADRAQLRDTSRDANMGYVNYSIHLPDPKLLKRIKAAAKEQDVTPAAFIRAAAERAVEEHEKKQRKAA